MVKAKSDGQHRGPWRRFFRAAAMVLDIVAVLALIVTAYAGMVSPISHSSLWGVLPLAFPAVLTLVVVLILSQIVWHWRGVMICICGVALCAGPVLDTCPLNLNKPKKNEGAETFTLMSYNAHQFIPPHAAEMPAGDDNPQLKYILDTDADIVCLQEATYLLSSGRWALPPAQLVRMHRQYPTVLVNGIDGALLCKYPAVAIHLDVNKDNFPGGNLACYRITLPGGRLLTVFNVHLRSMLIKPDDVEVYHNLTRLRHEAIDTLREHIIDKIAAAARDRARDAQQLIRYIRLYGGPDVIVTGDFNDVPGCYAIRTLSDAGFRSVYPSVGLGPMITYNTDRLYFRIDHTLWRGAMKPIWMKRGTLRASDHYPLLTEFCVE